MANPNKRNKNQQSKAQQQPEVMSEETAEVVSVETAEVTSTEESVENTPTVETQELVQEESEPEPASGPEPEVNVETSEIKEDTPVTETTSPYEAAVSIAAEHSTDKLHVANIIEVLNKLFSIKKVGATKTQYQEAAQGLISMIRSLNVITDSAFIAILPAILDEYQRHQEDKTLMFTDSVAPYKIFTNNQELRGLTKAHSQFLTAIAALAPSNTRKRVGGSIDIAANFAVLSEEKRVRVKDIFR